MKRLHVFSDASQIGNKSPCAGAYVIGRGGSPVQVALPDCRNSFHAELLVMIAAIEAAMPAAIHVHSDLKTIGASMRKASRGPAAKLRWLLKSTGAKLSIDAWNHPEYHECRYHAQLQAGCHGKRHPLRTLSPLVINTLTFPPKSLTLSNS